MKIIRYRGVFAEAVSEVVRDALQNHKYDFQGCSQSLIDHDISVYNPQYIESLARRAEFFLAVSDDEKEVFGTVCLDKKELHTCYTRGDRQNQKIGKRLMAHVENLARERGVKKLHLSGNFYARRFYESCGYKFIKDTTIGFCGARWPVVYMEKVFS